MDILKQVSQRMVKWILIGFIAVVSMRFYYVQEMLAALALFAALFSCVAAVLLILFLLDRACETVLGFLKLHRKTVLQHGRDWRTLLQPRYRI